MLRLNGKTISQLTVAAFAFGLWVAPAYSYRDIAPDLTQYWVYGFIEQMLLENARRAEEEESRQAKKTVAGEEQRRTFSAANRAVILLVDALGGMSATNRALYVNEAARAITSKLSDTDLFGIVLFDKSNFVQPLETVQRWRQSAIGPGYKATATDRTPARAALLEACWAAH